ncbi:hypothetical protein HPT27_15210 [Permianibacter sp. IMCC34836]|uniref:hypothetical protein n=1 Tax=Permianibacter fluminis TaxID=2738515 RepID=UPI001557980C|nr:hypothetical protein [Permianibacter fluminis]NQD38375.1 hypothetical protein [Permianibacter fluminis]
MRSKPFVLSPTALILAALIGLCTLPAVHAHDVPDGKKARDIDTVNADIEIGRDAEAGDLDTVNGDIEVGAGSKVGDADTVNGDITLADGVSAGGAETVNGDIEAGRDVVANGDIETVNGAIKFDNGGRVSGGLETVNGTIKLTGTSVERDIETVNGDISLLAGSTVKGKLIVRKPHGNWCLFSCDDDKPVIEIGANAEVAGGLLLEREVELRQDPSAKVGPIVYAYDKK